MSKKKIRLDLVSDVVCPWCIIGYKRLERALELVADDIEVELHWHPFELNPKMPLGGENLRDHLAAKYGTTKEGSFNARAELTQIGANLGFRFDYFDEMKMFNTFKAHQLLHYARQFGKETELKMRLFSAFFGERKVIDEDAVLVTEAVAVGLDQAEAQAVLADERFAEAVRAEELEWVDMGIRSVPTFVFNRAQAVSGAHEPEKLAEFMRIV
ncbi:frnE protein [Neiella marina]|uniref:FrnE protein n=1 Tax=Neiella marina TaxID=508461 RepID=A0A8J2XNV8_9GAMM|nr:DsbA family oxidoreductase [Neiella marina]GGA85428.1 frnE protein [Neiella marina]